MMPQGYIDVPLHPSQQRKVAPSTAASEDVDLARFQTTNEKDAEGNAIVRPSTLWEWLTGRESEMPPDVKAEYDAARERMAGRQPPVSGDVLAENAADLALGPLKGAANTATGLGEAAYNYIPGVARASDATQRAIFGDVQSAPELFTGARQAVQPTSPLQQAGFTGEQVGEFFFPVTRAAKYARVVEGLKAGATTLAQTGDSTTAGVSGALSAAFPGGRTVARVGDSLRQSAEKSVVRALAPTKEWAKEEATKLAPSILSGEITGSGGQALRLGAVVKGSRKQMLEQARAMTTMVGKQIGQAVDAAAAAGKTVSGWEIVDTLRAAREGLMTRAQTGGLVPIAGTEPVIGQLNELIAFVQKIGPDIPYDRAALIKTTWDRIVSKAGLYGPKAQASATDSASAWAIREAASSFRALLAKGSTTVDDLNQHYAFWVGLKNVLKETERRTQSHGGGLISGVTGGAGVIGGLMSGEDAGEKVQNAVLYGAAGRQLVRLLQSPSWATRVAGPLKQALADALASGNPTRIAGTVQRIAASLPAQFSPAPSPAK